MVAAARKFALIAAIAALAGGCRQQASFPPVVLDTQGVSPSMARADLAAVLGRAVRDDGLIDEYRLNLLAGRLDAQLKVLAVTGPTASPGLLPTPEDALAYWYNARSAWALKLVLLAGFAREMSDAALLDRRFPLDGRTMSLRMIDDVLEADRDFRTVVAAPGVTYQRAALPTQPFVARDIRAKIAERFEQFVDDGERFVIDVEARQVLVPPVLCRFRRRIIEDHDRRYGTSGSTFTTALLPYLTGSPVRRLQDAVGYSCPAARPVNRITLADQFGSE